MSNVINHPWSENGIVMHFFHTFILFYSVYQAAFYLGDNNAAL
jgi:hypothetical protein